MSSYTPPGKVRQHVVLSEEIKKVVLEACELSDRSLNSWLNVAIIEKLQRDGLVPATKEELKRLRKS